MPHRNPALRVHPARRFLARAWPLLALLGLAAFCLSPALGTGYWAEDIYYSAMIPANPLLKQVSWGSDTLDAVKHSMLVGRFYPITPVITAVAFILFQQVVYYKAYIVAMTLLDVAIFHALVRHLTGRGGFAALASLVTLALFQFRLSVDPILAYYGQIQWVIAALFLSLICLRRYLDGGRVLWLTLSVAGYLFCALAYEMTYTLVALPLFLIVQARLGWRTGVSLACPFVGAAGFCAGMTVLIRWLHPSSNYVHNTDFGFGSALGSLGSQISAGLPLSYYCADPLNLFRKGRDLEGWMEWLLQPGVIAVFVMALLLGFGNLRRAKESGGDHPGPLGNRDLLILGGLLATCPAILTAISPFHRSYLSFGVGWIGVMVQYYGVGLVLAVGLWRLVAGPKVGGSFAGWKCLAAAMVVAGVVAITFRANIEVATAINAPPGSDRYRQFVGNHGASWHLHRMNLVAALDAGVLDEVPDGSRVQLANLYPFWHDSLYGQFFYTKQTKKRIETSPTTLPTRLADQAPLFRVRDAVRDRKVGLVIVHPVADPVLKVNAKIPAAQGRIFVRHPALQPDGLQVRPILLVGQILSPAASELPPTTQVFRLGRDLPSLKDGPGWGLFAINLQTTAVNLDSLRLVDDPVQVASWLAPAAPSTRIATEINQGLIPR